MRVHQIIQGIANPSAGPSYSVAALSHRLVEQGHQVDIVAFGEHPTSWPFAASLKILNSRLEYFGLAGANAIRHIQIISRERAILHGNSVWRIANLFPLLLSSACPARIVWSPRGTFSAWSWNHHATLKRPFWRLFQKPALSRVHCFHATSIEEYRDIRRLGFAQPVAIIPNAVDVPPMPVPTVRKKRIVFLGRLHRVKGAEMLLAAWQRMADRFPDWELVIAGPLDSDYARGIQRQAQATGSAMRVRFPGEVTGQQKRMLLEEAALFVLPSYSENFGMAVAEALAHGVPVVTTTGTPWHQLPAKQCGWYVPPTTDQLERAMTEAIAMPLETLERMGSQGREWMTTDYDWRHAAEQMRQVYCWLLNGGEPPSCVRLD